MRTGTHDPRKEVSAVLVVREVPLPPAGICGDFADVAFHRPAREIARLKGAVLYLVFALGLVLRFRFQLKRLGRVHKGRARLPIGDDAVQRHAAENVRRRILVHRLDDHAPAEKFGQVGIVLHEVEKFHPVLHVRELDIFIFFVAEPRDLRLAAVLFQHQKAQVGERIVHAPAQLEGDVPAAAEREAKWAEMEAKLKELETEKTISTYKASYLAMPGFDEKLAEDKNVKSIILNLNQRNDNVILGEEEALLYGQSTIEDELSGLRFALSSKSFYQVNPLQTKVLYEKALEFADIGKEDVVLDLYCGIGTISLFMARHAKKVIGIEIVPEAIEDAKKNAQLNGFDNIEFICSDAGAYAVQLAKENRQLDVVCVDPPRKGCDEAALSSILKMSPKRIVYVSCDPSTCARDCKYLEENGYQIQKVQPVDMFPNSFHVESVVLLSHKSPDSVINVKVEFGEGEGKVPLDAIAERARNISRNRKSHIK